METCTVKLHSARSSGGRVIWPEVLFRQGETAETAADLTRILGGNARIEWALITGFGTRTPLAPDDPRIEEDGFLLRIPEKEARTGIRAECSIIVDEMQGHSTARRRRKRTWQ